MKEREIKSRLRSGESPLVLTIEKWEGVVKGEMKEWDHPKLEPLCQAYRKAGCVDCPVAGMTDCCYCRETAYYELAMHTLNVHGATAQLDVEGCEECRRLAQSHLDMLKGLEDSAWASTVSTI
jgi:hypothetical protein